MMTGGTKGQRLYPLYMGKYEDGERRREAFRDLAKAMGYSRVWKGIERGEPGGMITAMLNTWIDGGSLALAVWLREMADKLEREANESQLDAD